MLIIFFRVSFKYSLTDFPYTLTIWDEDGVIGGVEVAMITWVILL